MPKSVGIIANPFSGKDIRRISAYAATSNNLGKVQILQRVLVGLAEAGVKEVLYMPDPSNLVSAAFWALRPADRKDMVIRPVLDRCRGESDDTTRAAAAMVRRGVGAIIILGGDGTARLVARESRDVPLMPISAGTNNAFPFSVEPTVAGLAAGLVALRGETVGCRREKAIRITVGGETDLALVDVAFLEDSYIGSGAVLDPAILRSLVVTQGLPHAVGLSAVVGRVCPVGREDPAGAYIRFGPGRAVRFLFSPGQFAEVSVAKAELVPCESWVEIGRGPGVLAYDGERLRVVLPGETIEVQVTVEGPLVIDPVLVLRKSWR